MLLQKDCDAKDICIITERSYCAETKKRRRTQKREAEEELGSNVNQ